MAMDIKFELAADEKEELARLKAEHGTRPINGANILFLVISRTGEGFNETVENYESLLKDTYGAGNVRSCGAGYETIPARGDLSEGERSYIERLNYSRKTFLTQAKFAELIRAIGGGEEKYDQIHIIGHGDHELGLLFFGGRDLSGELKKPLGFDWEKAKRARLHRPENWPLNPGAKILLLGCGSAAGLFEGFLEFFWIVERGNVYSMKGDFGCEGTFVRYGPKNVPKKEKPIIGRFTYDWYHSRQSLCMEDIAGWLLIPRQLGWEEGIRPARLRLKRSPYVE